MKIKEAELKTVCGYTSPLPQTEEIQVAFAGKSNVGKSSLINAVMNRKRLARVGETPGKTRTINFYHICALCKEEEVERRFYLVDLPGYGYANVPQTEKAKWGQMIERYLQKSESLKMVFLLVDIRHAPGPNDRQMYDWILYNGYQPVIIATKADKVKRSQLQKQIRLIRLGLAAQEGTVILPFSALTKSGLEDVWSRIETVL